MDFPYAEDARNFYILGMDHDLGKALPARSRKPVKFLGKQYGMSRAMPIRSAAHHRFRLSWRRWTKIWRCTAPVPKAYFTKKISLLEKPA